MWYAICVFLGVAAGAFIMGLLARGKMEDYEEWLGWSETQRLRLQNRIDHEGENDNCRKSGYEKYLHGLAYSDDVKEKP